MTHSYPEAVILIMWPSGPASPRISANTLGRGSDVLQNEVVKWLPKERETASQSNLINIHYRKWHFKFNFWRVLIIVIQPLSRSKPKFGSIYCVRVAEEKIKIHRSKNQCMMYIYIHIYITDETCKISSYFCKSAE